MELKEHGYEVAVLALLAPRPARLVVTSFLPAAIAAVRALAPDVGTALLLEADDLTGAPFERADACGAFTVGAEAGLVDDALRQEAMRRRRSLLVWTVNEPAALTRFMRDPAVGVVITDEPDVATRLRGRRWTPPAGALPFA